MHYEELHELQTENAVKAAGKYRQEGKNYIVQVSFHNDLHYSCYEAACHSPEIQTIASHI